MQVPRAAIQQRSKRGGELIKNEKHNASQNVVLTRVFKDVLQILIFGLHLSF